MLRLFVALRPPSATRQALIGTMHGVAGARWQSDAQLHMTLAFIGDADEALAERIDAALRRVRAKPALLGVTGVGAFHSGGLTNALWAAAGPAEELDRLAHKIDHACRNAGAPMERRAFVPHITLARLNRSSGAVDSWLASNSDLSVPSSPIDRFGLYESRMGRGGSVYDLLADYALR
jgi:RNA 2',3'-cyclic 3'-phosphodiesterase